MLYFPSSCQRMTFAAVVVAVTVALLATAGPVQQGQQCPWGACEDEEVTYMNLLQVNADSSYKMQEIVEHNRSEPSTDRTMKKLFPYYHTSAELREKVMNLSKGCENAMTVETLSEKDEDGNAVDIDVVHVKALGAEPTNKVFILFGEHSRELISPESALRMLEILCKKVEADGFTEQALFSNILVGSEFKLVINGNPASRNKVEDGEFCLRANPRGVDLNRNWDVKWEAGGAENSETNGGPKAFSEPETRIFKGLVEKYQPDTFLTVHSGTKGMYMPYAYDLEHMAEHNAPQMLELLKDLDKTHCKCPFGAAGKEVGYPCPGTCMDWVYEELKTPYVFAFEIYTSKDADEDLQRRWEAKSKNGGMNLLQNGNHLGHEHFADLFNKHGSDFVQRKDQSDAAQAARNSDCFAMFNPGTEADYKETVHNWAVAYLEMASKIAKELKVKTIY